MMKTLQKLTRLKFAVPVAVAISILTFLGGSPVSAQTTSYPDDTNTGVPAGTTLTPFTGTYRITVDGTTVDAMNISGCVEIRANNVTIKRTKIQGCGGTYVIDNYASAQGGGTNLLIVDSTIICSGSAGGSTAVAQQDYTLRRVNISRCENGIWMEVRATIEDSFIHNLICYNSATDPHIDGVQIATRATNILIQHNRIYGDCDGATAGQGGNSAVFANGNPSGESNVTVTNNILAGGTYTLYCNQGGKGINNIYSNNRFSTIFRPNVGVYGPWDQCSDETIVGNVYNETGQLLPGQSTVSAPRAPLNVRIIR